MVCLYHGSIWVFWLKRCVCLVQCLDCKLQFWDQRKRLMKNCLPLVWNYNKYFWLDHFRNSTHWIHLNRSGYLCRSYLKLQAHSISFQSYPIFSSWFLLKKSFLSHICMNILALQKQNLASGSKSTVRVNLSGTEVCPSYYMKRWLNDSTCLWFIWCL